jgi:heat-inducible transcriptional repressor
MESHEHELNPRERDVLHAVVHHYITMAEPAGSRTIVKRFDLDVSAATVRNVMADLEDRDFLQQIHTSSGRVPTDKGYRFYVDHLMKVQELTLAERKRIEQELSQKLNDADDVLRCTSHLLALVSHQTGLAEAPSESEARVRRIEILPISVDRIAVLLVDNYGRVHSLALELPDTADGLNLVGLNRFLNEQLNNTTLGKLADTLEERMRDYLENQRALAEQALRLLRLLPPQRRVQLFLEGATQLFEQPEFSDLTKAREIFGLLEHREQLVDLLRNSFADGQDARRARVIIGAESKKAGLDGISLIASPYQVGETTVGMIGVLGPRRMPYSRLTAIVEHTASMVGRMLTRLTR